jgi:hypothetical protein
MDTVTIHGAAWRYSDIAEEVEWCRNRSWVRARYDSAADHSHCQICWWTLGRSENMDVGEGYLNRGKIDLWLCTECHDQFVAQQRAAGDSRGARA